MQVPSCSTYTLCVPRYNLESSDAYDQNHIVGGTQITCRAQLSEGTIQ